jgi:septation ring formation regulator EzrA
MRCLVLQNPQRLKVKEQLVRNNRELERMKSNLTALDEQQSENRGRLESTLHDLEKLRAALTNAQASVGNGTQMLLANIAIGLYGCI